jgi:hypothetical protein
MAAQCGGWLQWRAFYANVAAVPNDCAGASMEQSGVNRTSLILIFFAFTLGVILSNLLQQVGQKVEPEPPSPVLLNYRGQDFTAAQLPFMWSEQYCQLVRQSVVQQLSVLGLAALQIHVSDLAQSEGRSYVEAEARLLALDAITDQQVERYYADHPEKYAGPLFEVRGQIRRDIQRVLERGRRQELMRELLNSGDLVFFPDTQPALCAPGSDAPEPGQIGAATDSAGKK